MFGVKLWREYNTFLDHQIYRCAKCAQESQEKTGPVDRLGNSRYGVADRLTCKIGNLVPAVPTSDDTFWGLTSIPAEGMRWWRSLPNEVTSRGFRIYGRVTDNRDHQARVQESSQDPLDRCWLFLDRKDDLHLTVPQARALVAALLAFIEHKDPAPEGVVENAVCSLCGGYLQCYKDYDGLIIGICCLNCRSYSQMQT